MQSELISMTPEFAAELSSYCDELEALIDRIPLFASWRIPDLQAIADRYAAILESICLAPPFDVLCASLQDSLEGIHANVLETKQTGSWVPFDRAATILSWDMKRLLEIIR